MVLESAVWTPLFSSFNKIGEKVLRLAYSSAQGPDEVYKAEQDKANANKARLPLPHLPSSQSRPKQPPGCAFSWRQGENHNKTSGQNFSCLWTRRVD